MPRAKSRLNWETIRGRLTAVWSWSSRRTGNWATDGVGIWCNRTRNARATVQVEVVEADVHQPPTTTGGDKVYGVCCRKEGGLGNVDILS